jgi:hypothetical protein
VCDALGVSLADVLREISDDLVSLERRPLQSVGFAAAGRTTMRPVAGIAPMRAPLASPSRATAQAVAAVGVDRDEAVNPPAGRAVKPPAGRLVNPPAGRPVASVASLSARGLPVVAA